MDTKTKEIVNLKVYKHTRTNLKILAAQYGIPMVEMLDKLIEAEKERKEMMRMASLGLC